MDKRKLQNEEINRAIDEVKKAQKNLLKIVVAAQKVCEHKHLAEGPPSNTRFFAGPPQRICMQCGMVEDGWGRGYTTLLNPSAERLPQLSHFELNSLHRGLTIYIHDKEDIWAGKLTVQDLLSRLLINSGPSTELD